MQRNKMKYFTVNKTFDEGKKINIDTFFKNYESNQGDNFHTACTKPNLVGKGMPGSMGTLLNTAMGQWLQQGEIVTVGPLISCTAIIMQLADGQIYIHHANCGDSEELEGIINIEKIIYVIPEDTYLSSYEDDINRLCSAAPDICFVTWPGHHIHFVNVDGEGNIAFAGQRL